MKILIVPDKFKGSLTAKQVGDSLKRGIDNRKKSLQTKVLPMADGGDGLLDAIAEYSQCSERSIIVSDPLFRKVSACYLISEENVAYIEMAQASGLQLLSEPERNPLKTTTYGTGELIKDAIEQGAKKIILGIGGSATNDAGVGMAAALGYRFLDNAGNEIIPTGENLVNIAHIDDTGRINLEAIEVELACDVNNPLTGVHGAARVYAPQKGASADMVNLLDDGLSNFASMVKAKFGREISSVPGAGAAGGLGAGGLIFLNATIKAGIDLVLDYSKAEDYILDSDLVITGEGKLDEQSLQGKVVSGIAALCRKHKKPLVVVCGRNELLEEQLQILGVNAVYSICEFAINEDEAIKEAGYWLEEITKKVLADFSK